MEKHIPDEIMRKVKQDLIHEITPMPSHAVSGDGPIQLEPTFRGNEYYDSSMYLKFNNAIKRMSEPREVTKIEVDVETICRNESGSVYAVAIHYPDGGIDTDMLTKMKGTDKLSKIRGSGWSFYQRKFRFHPIFVNAYISSIYGYQRNNGVVIAKELTANLTALGKAVFFDNYCLILCVGGIEIVRCVKVADASPVDDTPPSTPDAFMLRPMEAIDFIPYEEIGSASIKDLYHHVLRRYVANEEYDIELLTEQLAQEIFELSLSRLKAKVGDKGMDFLAKMDEKG